MGHAGQEGTLGHIGGFRLLLGFFQTLNILHALGQIIHDDDIAHDVTITVMNLTDGNITDDTVACTEDIHILMILFKAVGVLLPQIKELVQIA